MYAFKNVYCKTQDDVDNILNNEIARLPKEDVISINVVPYFDTNVTSGFIVPICYYVCYIYKY